MAASCRSLTNPTPIAATNLGNTWIAGRFDDTTYNHVYPPNDAASDCSAEPQSGGAGAIMVAAVSARSAHSGGVNAMMLDGSVRFVKDGIAIKTWRAIATRNGGEVITADE